MKKQNRKGLVIKGQTGFRSGGEKNFAFIDSQNLNVGIHHLGWGLDFKKFRDYLRRNFGVTTAYIFIGYMEENAELYETLKASGYTLVFKPVLIGKDGSVKGNIDADLVLKTMSELNNYDKAVIVSSDGDFYSLVDYLYGKDKLKTVISPHIRSCSTLLKKSAKEKIVFMNRMRKALQMNLPVAPPVKLTLNPVNQTAKPVVKMAEIAIPQSSRINYKHHSHKRFSKFRSYVLVTRRRTGTSVQLQGGSPSLN